MTKTLKRNKLKYTKKMRRIRTKRKNTKRKYNKVKNTKRKYNKVKKNILNLNNSLERIKKQMGGDLPTIRDIDSEINGYKIVEELGEGKGGRVYKISKDTEFYALKEISLEGRNMRWNLVERSVKREIRCLERLREPPSAINVSHLLGSFINCRSAFIYLDFYSGGNLWDYDFSSEEGERLPFIFNISKQLLAALQSIHDKDIVHLDLKPENIMVDGEKNVFICDFGLSMHNSDIEHVSEEQTIKSVDNNPAIECGTIQYRDPLMFHWSRERKLCEIKDYKLNDIFSLGSILYELYIKILEKQGDKLSQDPGYTEVQQYSMTPGRNCKFNRWLTKKKNDIDISDAKSKFSKICLGLIEISEEEDEDGDTFLTANNRYSIERALKEMNDLERQNGETLAVPPIALETEPPQLLLHAGSEILEGFCYKQRPILGTWQMIYMVLDGNTINFYDSGSDNEQSQRGPAAGPSLLWLFSMGATGEELEREQSVGDGTLEVASDEKTAESTIDLCLYTYRLGKVHFYTIDMFSGGKDLDTIILEKKIGEEEGAFNNKVSLAFRTDIDGGVKKDELLAKLTGLGLKENQ